MLSDRITSNTFKMDPLLTRVKKVYSKEGLHGIYQRISSKILWKIKLLTTDKFDFKEIYDDKFFVENLYDSQPMAEYLAPKIAKMLDVKSAVDLGCASGFWVSALLRAGVDVIGFEGSESALTQLVCPRENIVIADLREPLQFKQKNVDLAISIEVAEHIERNYAEQLVDNIVYFNPKIVIFTAAPPGQTGPGHVNERPQRYWNKIFAKKGYKRVSKIEALIAKIVAEGKNEKNPPEIMQNKLYNHKGVFFPYWFPSNLMVYSKNPSAFDNL